MTRVRGALVVMALAPFLCSCGGSLRPSTQRAIAVGAGALGHGIVHAAYRCPNGADACRDSVSIGLVVAGGLALVAGSMAWLDDETIERPAPALNPLDAEE